MKAITLAPKAKIFVYSEPVSMACSFPKLLKLSAKMTSISGQGDLFLFVNKKRTYLKILFWAKNGDCIFSKKLPVGTFAELSSESLTISEMHTLVEHITLPKKRIIKQKEAA